MSALDRALNEFLQMAPSHIRFALVGGIAVAARTEPRFTRDLDFAISVGSELEAEATVSEFRQLGYAIETVLENTAKQRLSTVRSSTDCLPHQELSPKPSPEQSVLSSHRE